MSRFDTHFKMSPQDVIDYVREKLDFFDDGELRCEELSEGNINYVFRVWQEGRGKSLIVKHADQSIRTNPNRVIGTDRNRIEGEVLTLQGSLCPGMVPQVYLFDPVMGALCMEDLSDHRILRKALVAGEIFPRFVEDITSFMVDTLLPTTDIVMSPQDKKLAQKRFVNPGLCHITEDLVFTDPFTDYGGRNEVIPENLTFVQQNIYENKPLRLAAAKLKVEFMNNTQALIHGDLHTGSIFVKEDSTKVIDPEFACYAPMGYDLGNVTANLLLAWGNAMADEEQNRSAQIRWLEESVRDVTDLFRKKFTAKFPTLVTDELAKTEGFLAWYLSDILRYAAGVAGCEIIRRIVGNAQVIDTTSIQKADRRASVERVLLCCGRDFILSMQDYQNGGSYLATMQKWKNHF